MEGNVDIAGPSALSLLCTPSLCRLGLFDHFSIHFLLSGSHSVLVINGVVLFMVVVVVVVLMVMEIMSRICLPLYITMLLPCIPQNTLHLRSGRENIRSSAIYGASQTPGATFRRTSPRRPQGLPKTPKTLPRIATRRSPRLNTSRTRRNTGKNVSTFSPGLSAAFKSPHRSSQRLATNTTTTPSRWSKVSFLI